MRYNFAGLDLTGIPQAFCAQQTALLNRITAPTLPTGAMSGEQLVLSSTEAPHLTPIPVPPALEGLEDQVTEHLAPLIPLETPPRVFLFGPRNSITDPLYALRFLAKLGIKTGRPGELLVYDHFEDPRIANYYAQIPWSGHRAVLHLGSEGNYQAIRDIKAHMILAIHPGIMLDDLFRAFENSLVTGGVAVVQNSVWEDFAEDDDYQFFVDGMLSYYMTSFDALIPPQRQRLFRSWFSERSPNVQTFAIKKIV